MYLDDIEDVSKVMGNISNFLIDIARAGRLMGNDTLASRLYDMSLDLDDAKIKLNKAITENVNEQLQTSHQSSENMVRACMAGIAIAKETDDGL